MDQMGGELSDNRAGYPSALQTDLTLEPSECGGPVVNLDGKAIGVNIARGGRVKSYAVPAKDLRALLGDVKSGKFTITDLSELKSAAAAADEALKAAEAALDAARNAKRAVDEALENAAGKQ
jgi:serine protease Do